MKTPLEQAVLDWAAEKQINDPEKQYLKLLEELGELAKALLKDEINAIVDESGDVLIVTTILHHLLGGRFPDLFVTARWEFDMSKLVYAISNIQTHTNARDWIWEEVARLLGSKEKADAAFHAAYNKIVKRTGKTINGTFVKD